MKTTRPDLALERLLLALERDLTDASDEEMLAAAQELGLNPGMKGSAALMGVVLAVHWIGPDGKRYGLQTQHPRNVRGDELDR